MPAKPIKKRFSHEIITELLKKDLSKIDINAIDNYIEQLYEPLNDMSQLDWLPKKELNIHEN